MNTFFSGGKNFFIILAVIVLLAIGSGFFILQKNKSSNLLTEKQRQQWAEMNFYWSSSPRQLNDVTLSNLQGQEKKFSEHTSGWRLVNFGYMFCPDICPLNLASLHGLNKLWSEDGQRPPLNIVHVTIDPARDTPELLNDYLEYIDPGFYGLTGSVENIRRLARQLNFTFIIEKPDEYGHYFVTHSDSIALINPQDQYVGIFKGPYSEQDMVEILDQIVTLF